MTRAKSELELQAEAITRTLRGIQWRLDGIARELRWLREQVQARHEPLLPIVRATLRPWPATPEEPDTGERKR